MDAYVYDGLWIGTRYLSRLEIWCGSAVFLVVAMLWLKTFMLGRKRKSKRKYNIAQSKKILTKLHGMNDRKKLTYIKRIDPYVFEELILTALSHHGYRIKRGTRYSGDGGIDGHVKVGFRWAAIQAKRYSGAIKIITFTILTG